MNPLRDHFTKYPPKPRKPHQWFCEVSVSLFMIGFTLDKSPTLGMRSIFATSLLSFAVTFILTANRTILVSLALNDTLLLYFCSAFVPDYALYTLLLPIGVVVWLLSYFGWGDLVSCFFMVCFVAVVWTVSGFLGCIGVGILVGLVGFYLLWRASRVTVDPTIAKAPASEQTALLEYS